MVSQTAPHWYAFVTRPRHEKRVKLHLDGRGIESYLPLQKTVRQWKDRKKKVEIPLFSCYIFAFLPYTKRYDVLTAPSVVRVVSFENQPTPVHDNEIQAIRTIMNTNPTFDVCEGLQVGERIEIASGPLKGIQGELVHFHGRDRIAVNIDAISKSLLLDIERGFVKRVAGDSP